MSPEGGFGVGAYHIGLFEIGIPSADATEGPKWRA